MISVSELEYTGGSEPACPYSAIPPHSESERTSKASLSETTHSLFRESAKSKGQTQEPDHMFTTCLADVLQSQREMGDSDLIKDLLQG